jgi:DNA-directed RNA polymerase subunit RPC12/RpoP
MAIGTDDPLYNTWRAGLDCHTNELNMIAQMPTMLGTIAVLPKSSWSEAISNFHGLFMTLLASFDFNKDTMWPHEVGEDLLASRLSLCNIYVFIQRVTFYQARIHSQSLEDYMAKFGQIRKDIGIPVDFDIAKELHDIKICYRRRLHEIQESFSEALELEWVGPVIPITRISTKMENSDGVECIICGSDLSSHGILTVPCRHTYCTECLKHWIYAAQDASHTCPYCRTELFPKPKYRPKHFDGARNYQVELERYDWVSVWHSWIQKSAAWYNAELEMQQLYEVELATSVLPAN